MGPKGLTSPVHVLIAVFAAWLLVGCSPSSYSRLTNEDSLETQRALKSTYGSMHNHTSFVTTMGTSSAPIAVAVHEIETKQRPRVIFCIHGVFSDHRMWRFLAGDLATDYDVVLIDLPGCGDSEKPDPDDVPKQTYTPEDLTRRTLETMRTYLSSRADAPQVAILAHSYGGTLALRMFGDEPLRAEFAETIAKVDRLLLLAPLDVAVEKAHPVLIELSRISGIRIWTALQLGLLRDRVAQGMLENASVPNLALKQEADQKVEILTSWKARRAMQATLNRAVPAKGSRPDWSRIDPIVASYRRVDRPALIVWGVHDEVLPVSMGYKLAAQLPDARLITIPDGMHSFAVEQPDVLAAVIRADLGGTPTGRRVSGAEEAGK